jgi:SAM-dependent methyltransferase
MLKSAIFRFIPTTKALIKQALYDHNRLYDRRYYDEDVDKPASASSPIMAKAIVEHSKPKSVVDVGCETGALLQSFRDLACDVFGLEYADAALAYLKGASITRPQVQYSAG